SVGPRVGACQHSPRGGARRVAAASQNRGLSPAAAGRLGGGLWPPPPFPPPPKEVPPAPIFPATIEIPSRPIVESPSPPEPPAGKETGVLSTLEQMLRQDPLAGTDQPPRPPLPVGQ